MDGSKIGDTIALLRKNKGLTQAELAEMCDVTQPIIARWEKNQVQPRAKTLERLADALGVPITEFMSGDYTRIAVHLNEVHDPELLELIGQVGKLNEKERDALKVVLRAILRQIHIEEMVRREAS